MAAALPSESAAAVFDFARAGFLAGFVPLATPQTLANPLQPPLCPTLVVLRNDSPHPVVASVGGAPARLLQQQQVQHVFVGDFPAKQDGSPAALTAAFQNPDDPTQLVTTTLHVDRACQKYSLGSSSGRGMRVSLRNYPGTLVPPAVELRVR